MTKKTELQSLSNLIKETALASGLDLVGIAGADPFEGYRWQESVMRDPSLTLTDARAIVIVGVCEKGLAPSNPPSNRSGRIARSYATGHEFNLTVEVEPIRKLLRNHGYKAEICPGGIADSTIPLKLAAIRAGLGWQGKHSVVITKEYGSFVTWGGVITNAPLSPDEPEEKTGCGKCRLCMDACPTGAIEFPYIVNMDKCLDEILNESGYISPAIMEKMGDRVLSCESCLDGCPFNQKVFKKHVEDVDSNRWVDLKEALALDAETFETRFSSFGWSVDLSTFQRNCLIALGNTGVESDISMIQPFLQSQHEMLVGTTNWAVERIKMRR